MLELHARSFLGAASQISKMRQMLNGIDASNERTDTLMPGAVTNVLGPLEAFRDIASDVQAKLACIAANRMIEALKEQPCRITLGDLALSLGDIESRFADHLEFIKLFVIPEERAVLLGGADTLLKPHTAALYASVWFDCEESAKCLCLGRSTASVFHAMRILEIAIGAIAKRLKIPDPSKADRSWGNMLKAIKAKMDEQYPPKYRTGGCEGSGLEQIYVSLDAVKNPWRNGTMHVESVYTEEEARHILVCTSHLLDKMAYLFDENGVDAPHATLALDSTP